MPHRRVESLTDVTATTNQHSQGRVRQAFCSAARQELHAFFKLMAYLESFLQLPMPQPGQPGTLTLHTLLPHLKPIKFVPMAHVVYILWYIYTYIPHHIYITTALLDT